MESVFALFALFSLLLIASISDARHDPGEYWQSVMQDEAMPYESVWPRSNKKPDCHTSAKEKHFVEDFEPRPNLSAYDDDKKLTGKKSPGQDFEPRPNLSAYDDDEKLTGKKSPGQDVESRPNASPYHGYEKVKENKDFEPRPDATIYHD